MLLYEHPLSSYAQKVKIALREKGLKFDVETPNALGSGSSSGAVRRRQPAPRSADADRRRGAHLRFDDHPRIPRRQAPLARAAAARSCGARRGAHDRGRLRHALRGDQLGPGRDRLVQARRGPARRRHEGEGCVTDPPAARLARRASSAGKTWFGGDFGWADLSVAPYLNRSVHYGIGPADGSPLKAWHRRLCERPSVAATFKEFEAARQGMGNVVERLALRRHPPRVPRSPAGMDDEVGRRADRPRRPRQEQHPLHLAAW